MSAEEAKTCTAFARDERIASGDLVAVALKVKEVVDPGDERTILILDDATSGPIEVDLRGAALAGAPEARRCRARGHAAAAALGMARHAAGASRRSRLRLEKGEREFVLWLARTGKEGGMRHPKK